MGMALALLLLVAPTLAFIFARYSYEIGDEFLLIRRRVLGGIPFGVIRVRLDGIRAVEAVQSGWSPPGILIYGYLYASEAVLVTLRRRRYLLFRRILVTPDDVGGFIRDIVARSGAVETGPPPGVRTFLDRLPLRVVDAFAALSGLALLALLLVLLARLAWAANLLGPGHAWGAALVAAAAGLVLCMGLFMLLDCVRAATSEEGPVLYLWLVGILVVVPLAWVYYVLLWRPRRLASHSPGEPGARP